MHCAMHKGAWFCVSQFLPGIKMGATSSVANAPVAEPARAHDVIADYTPTHARTLPALGQSIPWPVF